MTELDKKLEFVRTGIGRFGGIGTQLVQLMERIQSDATIISDKLARLRPLYPQGSDRLGQLVVAGSKVRNNRAAPADRELWDGASDLERQTAESVSELLDKFREVVARYRKGNFERQIFIDDLDEVKLPQARLKIEQAEKDIESARELVKSAGDKDGR